MRGRVIIRVVSLKKPDRCTHATNEYVEIEEVLLTIKIIANLIVDWCGETIEK